jgi:hypothetical protein
MSKNFVGNPLIFVINEELNNWKKCCEKNNTVPAFMIGVNPSTGLFIYTGKDVTRDHVVATLRELLAYFESQSGNNANLKGIIH